MNLEAKGMERNIGSGRVIHPGDPEKSKFITLLLDDGEDRMPAKGGPLKKASRRKGGAIGVAADGKKPLAGTWTNVDGVKIEADLLQVADGKAVLRLKSGKLYRYPLEKLSEESRKKVEGWEAGE